MKNVQKEVILVIEIKNEKQNLIVYLLFSPCIFLYISIKVALQSVKNKN